MDGVNVTKNECLLYAAVHYAQGRCNVLITLI